MLFREAVSADIEEMHALRLAVKENVLVTHALVSRTHYVKYLFEDGKGWVCVDAERITGFAIVDLKGKSVWALFVLPEYEGKGIGKKLQRTMLEWYFNQTQETLTLSTASHTRAEQFYTATGWKKCELLPNGEVKFELDFQSWKKFAGN